MRNVEFGHELEPLTMLSNPDNQEIKERELALV